MYSLLPSSVLQNPYAKPGCTEHRTNVCTFVDVSMYQRFIDVKLNTSVASEYWKPMKRNLEISKLDSGLNPSLIISPRIESREFVRSCISSIRGSRTGRIWRSTEWVHSRTDRLIIASYLFYLRVCARTHRRPSHTHTEERARS